MRAFVARPFGTKGDIDFERVQRELIDPALARLAVEGGTTAHLLEAGNIRVDMFQELIAAELAIVDVSLHNANVFYELGIRHALRDRFTYLIRARGDAYPFDLQTDRYLEYDPARPGAALETLVEGLRLTLSGDRKDSPVRLLLPALDAVDPSRLVAAPPDFAEDVQRARAGASAGDLELLAEEVRGLAWERDGLRLVGGAQIALGFHDGARLTWEAVRQLDPTDAAASMLLGTIYQRLGDLVESDLALRRVADSPKVEGHDLAEVLALLARNAKERWRQEWSALPAAERRAGALGSPRLLEAAEGYRRAFQADLNHYYAGVNALGLYVVLEGLGSALPDAWGEVYDAGDPPLPLEAVRRRREQLAHAVRSSIEAARARAERRGREDPWVEASSAALRCLTESNRGAVVAAFRRTLQDAAAFDVDAAARPLEIYCDLGILPEVAPAALEAVRALARPPAPSPGKGSRVLVFTGHRIDAPGRPTPRVPAEKEEVARARLREVIAAERAAGAAEGLAGGASGGDVLFHEVCAELGIPTRLFLALPPDLYVPESVAPAGPAWVARFFALAARLGTQVLSRGRDLPRWLAGRKGYDVWQRSNRWVLHHALAAGPQRVTLVALWDGAPAGDGPGGTAGMVREAQARGARTEIVDTRRLFAIP